MEKTGQRKAVFPVSGGDVTFFFPEGMTLDGMEELEAYLAVFIEKEKGRAHARANVAQALDGAKF